ncbi:MAG: TRAP transporter large permease, partial [Planctomycetes bacterium]|nr:TRAP transporter large permease [Planctomycetota bacterium]
IPPSHNMIFYAMAAGGVSVGHLFLAGLIPGILLGIVLMVYVGYISIKRNFPKGEAITFREGIRITYNAMLSLFTAFIILGGVTLGWFTATESAAIACLYAFFISVFVYRELGIRDMPMLLANVVRTLTISFSLIASAGAFGWIAAYLQVPRLIAGIMISISSNPSVILLLIILMLLILGCFMDMAPLIFICTPILLPVARSIEIHNVHFGVIMIFCLAVGLCTPPVGSALFVGCAVGKSTIERVVSSIWGMYIAMVVMLLLTAYIPALSLWLPGLL